MCEDQEFLHRRTHKPECFARKVTKRRSNYKSDWNL